MTTTCTAKGQLTPSITCGLIAAKTNACTSEIGCVFQKTETSVPATANFPTGSLGEEVES